MEVLFCGLKSTSAGCLQVPFKIVELNNVLQEQQSQQNWTEQNKGTLAQKNKQFLFSD